MLADRILLTKADLTPDTAVLEARLRALNAAAPIRAAVQGEVPPIGSSPRASTPPTPRRSPPG
jgi:G3E family GTPase